MLLWRAQEAKFWNWTRFGEFSFGLHYRRAYNEQSVKLYTGDMILAFSDGATEVHSPDGKELTPKGFLEFAERTMGQLSRPLALPSFSEALLKGFRSIEETLNSRTISRCLQCAALPETLPGRSSPQRSFMDRDLAAALKKLN